MDNILSAEQKSAELYRLAYQCAVNKQLGCKGFCGNCQLNVSLYADNPREAVLIRTSAEMDAAKAYQKRQNDERESRYKLYIFAAIILAVIIKCNIPSAPKPQQTAPVKGDRLYTTNNKSVTGTIDEVHRLIYDLNKDGEIDCVDYACLFYKLWGNGAYIMRNYNSKTGFNHLFNAVENGDGYTIMIEPQSRDASFDMWGSRYNPMINEDETEYWAKEIERWENE
jgi:uncharacterized protein YuzB (UPF0349 family)